LCRRHELKALVDIHAEQEGEEMATLTLDEAQVPPGRCSRATHTQGRAGA
jgi:hypothetical protein